MSKFIKTAHKYLDFRDDEVVPSDNRFLQTLNKTEALASTNEPIAISGPWGSGKRQLAAAIAESAGGKDKDFVPIDCRWEDESYRVLAKYKNAGPIKTLFVTHINESKDLQKTIAAILQSNASTNPRIILATIGELDTEMQTYDLQLNQVIEEGSIRPDIVEAVRNTRLNLPSLRERPWDIVPIVVSLSLKTLGINYISYNSFDFLLWQYWPRNIHDLRLMLSRSMAVDTDTNSLEFLKHIKESFPQQSIYQIKTKSKYDYDWYRDFDGPRVSFLAYGLENIAEKIGNYQCTNFLVDRTFFLKGSRQMREEDVGPREIWVPLRHWCEPPYDLGELLREVEFAETGAKNHCKFLSIDWLSEDSRIKAEKLAGHEASFMDVEEIRFDIQKMQRELEPFLSTKLSADVDLPIEPRIPSSDESVQDIPGFLRKLKKPQTQFEYATIINYYLSLYRREYGDVSPDKVRLVPALVDEVTATYRDRARTTITKKILLLKNIRETAHFRKKLQPGYALTKKFFEEFQRRI